MLFHYYNLKAHEHTKVGRTNSNMGNGTIRGACERTVMIHFCQKIPLNPTHWTLKKTSSCFLFTKWSSLVYFTAVYSMKNHKPARTCKLVCYYVIYNFLHLSHLF